MSCTYYEFKGGLFSGDYWCTKKDCRVDEDIYYKYCRNYDYKDCPIYKHQESSGCFITTVACQILRKKDNDPILTNLRNFRNNILQKNEKYYDILKNYDVIGPIIADCILNDKEKEQMTQSLYQKAIIPINDLINKKEYDKAVEAYYLMTLLLVNYYGLKRQYNNIKDNNYNDYDFNPQNAGHGLKRAKKIF